MFNAPFDEPTPRAGDALLVVDVQNDFLPGGALGVPDGDEIIAEINQLIAAFESLGLPVILSRDWHPPGHCSFEDQGGVWPVHCVQNTRGAEFSKDLRIPENPHVISKATRQGEEAYSAFEETGLADMLTGLGVTRLFIVGLATDYCVLYSVRDARRFGFEVIVPESAVRAVNVHPEDGTHALDEMRKLGAELIGSGP